MVGAADVSVLGHQGDGFGQCGGADQAVARVARVVGRELIGQCGYLRSDWADGYACGDFRQISFDSSGDLESLMRSEPS